MRAVNRIADGRAIVARARRVERRRATRSTRAEKEGEQMNQEMAGGEIGLGGLEDMMDKADGGATPDFVKSLGVKELDDVFAILGSQTKGAELGQLVLSEKFGETLYRESGFTSLAETINGRCAVRWRVARVASFDGDYASRIAMGGRGRARAVASARRGARRDARRVARARTRATRLTRRLTDEYVYANADGWFRSRRHEHLQR
jgi:hypothetical protein